MRPVHHRTPRRLLRQFAVWMAWFLLSGYVFHGRTERELRRLTLAEIVLRLGSLMVVLLSAYWFFGIMPANVRTFLTVGALVGLSLGLVPVLVQTGVTKYLELRQIWPAER